MENIRVNDKNYVVIELLGKGKGGYSYLVSDGARRFVVKQIHHEPCDYYAFGDKFAAELSDYAKLKSAGVPVPELIDADAKCERILKEYIDGETASDLISRGELAPELLDRMHALSEKLRAVGLNIDYYPTNFVLLGGALFYVDTSATPILTSGALKIGASNIGATAPIERGVVRRKYPAVSILLRAVIFIRQTVINYSCE